jgi:hypothetical protein
MWNFAGLTIRWTGPICDQGGESVAGFSGWLWKCIVYCGKKKRGRE